MSYPLEEEPTFDKRVDLSDINSMHSTLFPPHEIDFSEGSDPNVEGLSEGDELVDLGSFDKIFLERLNERAAKAMASEPWPGCEYHEPSPEAIQRVREMIAKIMEDENDQ